MAHKAKPSRQDFASFLGGLASVLEHLPFGEHRDEKQAFLSTVRKLSTCRSAETKLLLAFECGRLYERMGLAEPAEKYESSRNGAIIIAKRRSKTAAIKRANEDWQGLVAAEIEKQVAIGEKPRFKIAVEDVAESLGESARNIERYVENVWTSRKRR